jgi:hypothetical protein
MKDKKMSPEAEMKIRMLKELKCAMNDIMLNDSPYNKADEKELVAPMKKVTVAASDDEHLQQGLDKAKDLLSADDDAAEKMQREEDEDGSDELEDDDEEEDEE